MTTSIRQKIALVFLGLFLSLVLLEVGMRLGGFVLLSIQECGNLRSIKQKNAYRILCLGESTTQGQYPHLLEQVLNQRNSGVHFSVIDKGKASQTTITLMKDIESNLAEYHPNMVITMMGINDGGRHMPFETLITSEKTPFIQTFRTYKLAQFLWLHLLTKAKEMGFCKPAGSKPISAKVKIPLKVEMPVKVETPLSETVFKKTPTKPIVSKGSLPKAIELNLAHSNKYIRSGWLSQKQGKLAEAEDSFKKAIEINPKNERAYFALGMLYRYQGKLVEAEDSFKKAGEINPGNDETSFALGILYRNQGKLAEAEDAFKKTIEFNPKNEGAYVGLGWLYRNQGKLAEAEDAFKKIVLLNSKSDDAYVGLGVLFLSQRKLSQAEASFKKAIELNPNNDTAYGWLGQCYQKQCEFSQTETSIKKIIKMNPKSYGPYVRYLDQNKFSKTEDLYKQAIEHNPRSVFALFKLGMFYRDQGKLSQAEASLRKAVEIDPENEAALGALASLCAEIGKADLAQEYFKKANRLRLADLDPVTVNNYRKLKEILDRKGIRLVCVQYPVRNVEPLKKIFGKDKGVIFVDNEQVFKEAVRKGSYKKYFRDMFGGDFGHCTPKGNMLLAENIADVILKEVFDK